ncbi:MAG: hypothetical protein K8R34_09780 [Methanosarcinales archaeon]|nr:hypothetical protein [Methanosarcinales archaeon]
MVSITELVKMVGPEKTCILLSRIGKGLAETQGAGLEGVPEDDLHYLPICPFADEIIRFVDLFGERPEEFQAIVKYVNEKEAMDKDKVECPAMASILCLLHNAYRKKRAEMAGFETLHLASKLSIAGVRLAYNEEAMEKAGKTKEDVDKILEKGACVFKFVKME